VFQPFLRFYPRRPTQKYSTSACFPVSTLLEILLGETAGYTSMQMITLKFQPFLRFYGQTACLGYGSAEVSTLLEILPLVCFVLLGF